MAASRLGPNPVCTIRSSHGSVSMHGFRGLGFILRAFSRMSIPESCAYSTYISMSLWYVTVSRTTSPPTVVSSRIGSPYCLSPNSYWHLARIPSFSLARRAVAPPSQFPMANTQGPASQRALLLKCHGISVHARGRWLAHRGQSSFTSEFYTRICSKQARVSEV